jgi:hypothetical protein
MPRDKDHIESVYAAVFPVIFTCFAPAHRVTLGARKGYRLSLIR